MKPFELETENALRASALFANNRTLRRELRRWWVPKPARWCAWLMLNPSNASESADDPTALRVTQFTRRWGYDGWIGVNLYPRVTSDPAQMWRWAKEDVRRELQVNLEDIERVARAADLRMAAFGAAPREHDPEWLKRCLVAFAQPAFDQNLFCLGTTKSGEPLHPLARGKHRVPDNAGPILWCRQV